MEDNFIKERIQQSYDLWWKGFFSGVAVMLIALIYFGVIGVY